MGKALKEALIGEVFASMQSASAALEIGDVDTAKWALGHAVDAKSRFEGPQEQPQPEQRKRRRQRREQKPKPRSSRNGRVSIGQRRSDVMELLHRENRPLTTAEIAKRLGTSRTVVTKATNTIDGDLLEVARGQGRQPTRFALASVRDKV